MNLTYDVKKWYVATYPEDELGQKIKTNLNFAWVWRSMATGLDIYRTLGVEDSTMRERVFEQLAKLLEVDYDVVYYTWLNEYDKALIALGKDKQ